MQAHARDLNAIIPQGAALVEFGSGSCTKVQILLDNVPAIAAYLPVDISGDFLKCEAGRIAQSYPHLPVHPVVADFTKPFALPGAIRADAQGRIFPGLDHQQFRAA